MLGFNVLMVYEKLWGAVPSEIRHSICREYRIYVGLHKILYGCLLISLKWLILRLLLSFFFLFSFLLHLLMDLTIFSHIILPFSLHFSHLHLLMFWHDSFRHLMNVSLGWFSIPWWRYSFADLTIRKLNSILKSLFWCLLSFDSILLLFFILERRKLASQLLDACFKVLKDILIL